MLNKTKIIVIDVDETLGYFVELGIFWDSLHNYAKTMNIDAATILTQHHFNETLDIFPEFVRPKILSILQYIKLKKILKQCDGVIIYTNNQGPKEWIQFIKNYFESKIKYKLQIQRMQRKGNKTRQSATRNGTTMCCVRSSC